MSQSKIPPTLSAMPAPVLEKIVEHTDFLTKLALRKVKPLRNTVKNEKTQVYQIYVNPQNDHYVKVSITVSEKSPYDTDQFKYKQVDGGCLIKKRVFSKLIVDGDMNELIAADLSLILANPLITIDKLWFEHEQSIFNVGPIGGALSTLLSKIEETILKKRSRTLNVNELTIYKTKEPADVFKMLPYVTPGVLKHLSCSAVDENINIGQVTQLPHFEHLESLNGFANVTAEIWSRFKYMHTGADYNNADILVLLQAALDHGQDFQCYDFGVVDGFDQMQLNELISQFGETGSFEENVKYISMANGTDILLIQLFDYGRLKISKNNREQCMRVLNRD